MQFFKIILNTGREILVQAANKGAATEVAIESGQLDKFDLYDVEEILSISEVEYLRETGKKKTEI